MKIIEQDSSRNFKAEDSIRSAHEHGFNNGFDYKFIKTLEVTNENGKATDKKELELYNMPSITKEMTKIVLIPNILFFLLF